MDMELLNNDFEAWSAKNEKEFKELLEAPLLESDEIEFLDVIYSTRPVKDTQALLPRSLSRTLDQYEVEERDILQVDATVMCSSFPIPPNAIEKPATFRILKGAFLFKGSAASVIYREGL
jgi:hypothetical protein